MSSPEFFLFQEVSMKTQSCEGMKRCVQSLYHRAYPALNDACVHPGVQVSFFLALVELHMLADEAEKETNKFRKRPLVKEFLHKKTTLEAFLSRVTSESRRRIETPVIMQHGATPSR